MRLKTANERTLLKNTSSIVAGNGLQDVYLGQLSINVFTDTCESNVQMLRNRTGTNEYWPFLTFRLQDWCAAFLRFPVEWQ